MAYRKFQRCVQDFDCEHCGAFVKGNGYTNHCPECLWSKHEDISPGDRAASCGGLMQPVTVAGRVGEYRLHHRCQVCGAVRSVKAAKQDNFEQLLAIASGAI